MGAVQKRGCIIIALLLLFLFSVSCTLAQKITVKTSQEIADINPLLFGNNILYWDELRKGLSDTNLLNHSGYMGTTILRFHSGNSYDFEYPYEFPWDLGNTELGKSYGSITPDNFASFANSINSEKIMVVSINRTDPALILSKTDTGAQITIQNKKIYIYQNELLVREISLSSFSSMRSLVTYINSISNLNAQIIDSFSARENENPIYLKETNRCPSPCTLYYQISTPEKAAEYVRYMNTEKGYNIKYWELGNEMYSVMDAEEYAKRAVNYSKAMKAVDPSIKIGLNFCDKTTCWISDWNNKTAQIAGSYADFIIIHIYPYQVWEKNVIDKEAMLAFSSSYESSGNVQRMRNEFGANSPQHNYNLPIAVTEYNIKDENEDYKTFAELSADKRVGNTMLNALYIADLLGLFMKNKVDMAMVFKLSDNTSFGTLYTYPYTLKPVSYILYLFTHHFGDKLINASISASPIYTLSKQVGNVLATNSNYLSAYASKDSADVYLLVINKHLENAITATVELDISPSSAKVYRLTSSSADSSSVSLSSLTLQPQSSFIYSFPAHSIMLFEFSTAAAGIIPSGAVSPQSQAAAISTQPPQAEFEEGQAELAIIANITQPSFKTEENLTEEEKAKLARLYLKRENLFAKALETIKQFFETIKAKFQQIGRIMRKSAVI